MLETPIRILPLWPIWMEIGNFLRQMIMVKFRAAQVETICSSNPAIPQSSNPKQKISRLLRHFNRIMAVSAQGESPDFQRRLKVVGILKPATSRHFHHPHFPIFCLTRTRLPLRQALHRYPRPFLKNQADIYVPCSHSK